MSRTILAGANSRMENPFRGSFDIGGHGGVEDHKAQNGVRVFTTRNDAHIRGQNSLASRTLCLCLTHRRQSWFNALRFVVTTIGRRQVLKEIPERHLDESRVRRRRDDSAE
jgi:hypothetical protein